MYKVCLYNKDIETVIHYPTVDAEAPHLDKLPLKEGLSLVDSLSFSIYTNNIGYNLINELVTKIKVIDIRDNSIRFTGRILDAKEHMDSEGKFYKDVLCEGALSYLSDSKTRAETYLKSNVADFLNAILAIHNSKVENYKKIQIGNIDVTGSIAYTCSFKTTLESLLEVKEKIGGDIRVRETDGILYLDWLQNFSGNTVEVRLGVNMKEMIKGKDVTSLGTRIIPLGANNLTIESVNGGLDYIEDVNAKNIYGTIEKTVEYKNITDATVLKNDCMIDLPKYTQPLFLLEASALDLSYLTGNKAEQFRLGANLHIVNLVMNIDDGYKVVELDLDLLQPYDPKLTIANFPVKLSTSINDLRKSSVQNNGVYNNVQVGDAFGIRAVRSDNKVTTTINATEGISIENQSKKVFSVDENGNLVANDGTYNNITAEGGKFNNITANKGTFNDITTNNMVAKEMRTSDTTNYMVVHDHYIDIYNNGNKVMDIGVIENHDGNPVIEFLNPTNGNPYFTIWGNSNGSFATIGGLNSEVKAEGHWNFDSLTVGGSPVGGATPSS